MFRLSFGCMMLLPDIFSPIFFISFCENQSHAPERNARFFLLKYRYTTFCVVITALTLMHKPLALS